MFLSDLINNAATAAVMCPDRDRRRNNTLILRPGGFRFGDCWFRGLRVEIAVVAVSLPLLLGVRPLRT